MELHQGQRILKFGAAAQVVILAAVLGVMTQTTQIGSALLAQDAAAASIPPGPPPMPMMVMACVDPQVGPVSQTFSFCWACLCIPGSSTWDFGDGTPPVSGLFPSHKYTKPGTYTATVSARGSLPGGGVGAGNGSVVVTVQPDYFFVYVGADTVVGIPPLTVNFTAGFVGGQAPITFLWDFGDSTTSTEQNPTHTYSIIGSYTAKLVATDSRGWKSGGSATIFVSVGGIRVSTAVMPADGSAPLSVGFTATASGGTGPYTYSWTFGDGGSGAGSSVSHTYQNPGTYTAMVTVKDSTGDWTVMPAASVNAYPPTVGPPFP